MREKVTYQTKSIQTDRQIDRQTDEGKTVVCVTFLDASETSSSINIYFMKPTEMLKCSRPRTEPAGRDRRQM